MSANINISMEGTIGAGKSTFLGQFDQHPSVTVVEEDLGRWLSVPGAPEGESNLLCKFYQNPKRYSHAFQSYVMMTKKESHVLNVDTPVKVMERSVQSARFVFAKLMHESGLMTNLEHALIHEHGGHYMVNGGCRVDYWVYLRTPAHLAFERVKKRGRVEELEAVSKEYLEKLEKKYDYFFDQVVKEPVIRVNGDQPIVGIYSETKAKLAAIPELAFIAA